MLGINTEFKDFLLTCNQKFVCLAVYIASETKDKKTFKHLKGVIKSIDKQNKLIRLADKSEVGWLMVNEYVTDDLASDSGDDAKIRKAEKRG